MNFKRITALLLAVLFFVFALASCSKKEEGNGEESSTPAQTEGVAEELKNYTIIRGDSSDAATLCMKLSSALEKVVGDKMNVRNDENTPADDSTFEILVGDTNRTQSSEAKAQLQGLSYSITKNGNKIVIAASNNMILEDAVNYFIANAKKQADGTVSYPTNYTETGYQALDLVTNGKANYTVIFTDFYNNLNYHSGNYNSSLGRGENSYDKGFTETKAKEFTAKLKEITGVKFLYDKETRMSSSKKEIIIGKPKGNTNTYFDYYENGVYLNNGDIYIYGHNHEGIEAALTNFINRVNLYKKIDNSKNAILCSKDGYKFTDSNIKYDIPLPSALAYEGAYTAANNGIYFVYTQDTTSAAFNTYCSELSAAGYTQYFNRTADQNLFAGFYKGDEAAWVYYIAARKEMRVVFETYQPLPTIETSGPKVQDAYVTQMGCSYTDDDDYTTNKSSTYNGNGMGYIIGLEDGRYIVIDGGQATGGKTTKEKNAAKEKKAKEYYDYLKNNNKRSDGIVIAAWILTHGHQDHYSNFEQFGKTYGSQVKCQYIIQNIPTELTLWGSANTSENSALYYIRNQKTIANYFKGATVYTVHTGYAATIGGVYLEFMFTYEDLYNNNDLIQYTSDTATRNAVDEFNDTSLNFRFVFNKGKSDEAGVFFLGDNYYDAGERLASMWSAAYMKTTVVQVAHHGWGNGVTSDSNTSRFSNIESGKSSTYAAIRASYGFYTNYRYHMTKSPTISNLIKSYRSNATFYCNTAADGSAANYKMTFNGGINVTETKLV